MQISTQDDVAKLISHDRPTNRLAVTPALRALAPTENDKLEVDLGTVLAAAGGFEADTAR